MANNPYSYYIKNKPKERVGHVAILKEVAKRTGFRYKDIYEVCMCFIDVIVEKILQKKTVVLPKLGIFFPAIRKGHWGNDMQGGTEKPGKIWIRSKWVFKVQPGNVITRELYNLSVSEEEEEAFFAD